MKTHLTFTRFVAASGSALLFTTLQTPVQAELKLSKGIKPMTGHIKVIGRQFDFVFGKNAIYRLHFVDTGHLDVTVMADPSYPIGTLNHFEIGMTEIRPDVYMVTWIEPATGNTVTHVDDFANNVSYTNITDLASKGFWRMKGEIRPVM